MGSKAKRGVAKNDRENLMTKKVKTFKQYDNIED